MTALAALGLRELLTNSIRTLGRQVWAALLQLAAAAIIAKTYGPKGTGMYAVALLLPNFGAMLLSFGLVPANTYFIASRQYSARAVASKTIAVWAVVSGLGLGVGFLLVKKIGANYFPGIPEDALILALACFPSILFISLAGGVLQGLQNFSSFNLSLTLQPLLALIGIAFCAYLGGNSTYLLVAYLISSSAAMCVVAIVTMSALKKSDAAFVGRYPLTVALNYGIKSHLSSIVSFLNYRIDIFLVNYLLGPGITGLYAVSVQIVEKLWLLSQAVSTVLLPKLSESARDGGIVTSITTLATRLTIAMTLIGAIGLGFLGHFLIGIVFGPSFLRAYTFLLILLPGAVAGAGVRLLSSELSARGRPEINLYMGVFVVVLNVALNVLLIPYIGAIGAAVATTIAYMSNLAVRLIIFKRFTNAKIADAILPRMADFSLLRSYVFERINQGGVGR